MRHLTNTTVAAPAKPLKTSLLYLSLGLFLLALALFGARAVLRRLAARQLQAARHALSSSAVDDAGGGRQRLIARLRRRCVIASVLAFCALWYATSISFTLYNKYVLYYWEGGCGFPVIFTSVHMGLKAVVAFAYLRWLRGARFYHGRSRRRRYPWARISSRDFLARACPVGMATGLDIACSNLSFLSIDVSFYTIVKTSSLAFTLLFAVALKLQPLRAPLVGIVVWISAGIAMASYGETVFHAEGFVLVLLAALFSGFRWALTQLLMTGGPGGRKNKGARGAFTAVRRSSTMGTAMSDAAGGGGGGGGVGTTRDGSSPVRVDVPSPGPSPSASPTPSPGPSPRARTGTAEAATAAAETARRWQEERDTALARFDSGEIDAKAIINSSPAGSAAGSRSSSPRSPANGSVAGGGGSVVAGGGVDGGGGGGGGAGAARLQGRGTSAQSGASVGGSRARKRRRFDALETLFLIAPASFLVVFPVVFIGDQKIHNADDPNAGGLISEAVKFSHSKFASDPALGWSVAGIAVGGGLFTFLLIIVELKLMEITSALELGIAGFVKEILTILFSIAVFGEHMSPLNVAGLLVTMLGVAAFLLDKHEHPLVREPARACRGLARRCCPPGAGADFRYALHNPGGRRSPTGGISLKIGGGGGGGGGGGYSHVGMVSPGGFEDAAAERSAELELRRVAAAAHDLRDQ